MKQTMKNLLPAAVLVFFAVAAHAGVPQLISYQGRLTDSTGVPFDTTAGVTFAIYADSNGVTSLWSETHPAVVIADGLFQVLLGSISPLGDNVLDGRKRWLGIELQGGLASAELIPIVSVAYAYRAARSDTASYALAGGGGGGGWTDDGPTVRLTTITDSVGIGNASPKTKLHVGSAPTDKQAVQIEGLTVVRTNAAGQPTNVRLANLNGGANSGTSIDFQGLNSSSMTKDAARVSGLLTSQLPTFEKGALTFATNDAARDGLQERVRIDEGGRVGIGTSNPSYRLDVVGTVHASDSLAARRLHLGSATEEGIIRVAGPQTGLSYLDLGEYSGGGADLRLLDPSGSTSHVFQKDASGGGYMALKRQEGALYGFMIDGNYGGSEEPVVSITGSTRSAIFDMGASGDASVELPSASISSTETRNEAGIAHSQRSTGYISIGNSATTILSRMCSFPTSGYVLVIGTLFYHFWHYAGTDDYFHFGVSDVAGTFPTDQDFYRNYTADWSTFNFQDFVTVQGFFSVDAGIHTFYLLGQTGATGNPVAGDGHLSVLFFPTAYLAVVGKGDSENPEQEAIDAAIQARIAAETEKVRDEFDAKLKAMQEQMKKQLGSEEE